MKLTTKASDVIQNRAAQWKRRRKDNKALDDVKSRAWGVRFALAELRRYVDQCNRVNNGESRCTR